ncbi:hypothetical protein ACFOON_11350 [Novosphingobium piscinae]|uniref:Uncharacterized protein n=1 Tax=Novosphingobium piscinae TaxID=1507448 RepID=A0A7X1FWC3_9SPHN|nr:hypothetical protein [Novosphingobium piscinae]MBC2668185.1 hypothetical protein [Novosphingobium piscinae]
MDTAGFTMGAIRYGGTRHPFRASLPRRVLRSLPHHEPEVAARLAAAAACGDNGEATDAAPAVRPAPRRGWRITTQDVKDFLIAYTACLLAVTTFLG